VGLHPNGFQDRPVVTASVPLHKMKPNLTQIISSMLLNTLLATALPTSGIFHNVKYVNGDPTATRTRDTLIKSQVLYRLSYWTMAGDTGFEPVNDGVKVRCLTAWRIPKKKWGG
jgi:hypothetical protein